jgi:hypothetical protein
MKRIVTRALIVVASILGIVFAQVAPASAQPSDDLASNLATLWKKVIETPTNKNPIGTASACWDIGGNTVAPFFGPPPNSSPPLSCTVKANTTLFIAGWSTECSNVPGDSDGGVNLTEPELRQCAIDSVAKRKPTTVTLDGTTDVPLTEVQTPALKIHLPKDNILGAPKGKYLSVADGLVALLPPLPPGEHEIVIVNNDPDHPDDPITTTTRIVVTPGH